MVMGPNMPRNKFDSAGEAEQQFTWPNEGRQKMNKRIGKRKGRKEKNLRKETKGKEATKK
jgi:hypothetical protein